MHNKIFLTFFSSISLKPLQVHGVSSSTKPQVYILICRVYSHVLYTSPHYSAGQAGGLGNDGGLHAAVDEEREKTVEDLVQWVWGS